MDNDALTADDLFTTIGRLYVQNLRISESLRQSVVRERRMSQDLETLRTSAADGIAASNLTETVGGFSD